MSAPSVPEFEDFPPRGNQGNEQKSPRLTLSDQQWRSEHLLAAAVALEFVRITAPSDSHTTAAYAAATVDNSRTLAAGNARLHFSLLRGQLKWLRSLPAGSGELTW
jgi:hypothetical protein